MSRPLGVTASAIVAIFGSILMLLLAVFSVVALSIEVPQPEPPNSDQLLVSGAVMSASLAGIGIWTSVGLLRLRSWARTSILVFAVFLAAFCALTLVIVMAGPVSLDLAGATGPDLREVTAVMFGIPLVIAGWWLIQFSSRSTKAAFASSAAGAAPPRPISISVIGWVSIIGGASSFLGILTGLPVFLLGATFDGWAAGVIYVILGALLLFIGKGLLELWEQARILAIGWLIVSFVHTGLVTLVPSVRKGFFEMQRAFAPDQPDPMLFDYGMLLNVSFAFGAVVGAVAIWFLIRNRTAFVRAEKLL